VCFCCLFLFNYESSGYGGDLYKLRGLEREFAIIQVVEVRKKHILYVAEYILA